MIGTSWPSLTAGGIARASDVEAKFDWIEGSLVPMSAGSTTDGVHDLGTTTAYWRTIYVNSIAGTSTAHGVAIGTTTVANNSDIALEIAGIRSFLFPRMTTTQRTNLAGISGMVVYDSTLGQFYAYEAGSWKAMLGSPMGFAAPISASVTSNVTTSVASISAPGKILRIAQQLTSGVATASQLQLTIDGLIWGEFSWATTGVSGFLTLGNALPPATATAFAFSAAANQLPELNVDFKSSLVVYHRANAGGSNVITTLYYERT